MRLGSGGARLLIGVLAIVGVAGMCDARVPADISKIEARALPAGQVKRRVMAQLSALLTEERPSRKGRPKRLLTDMAFIAKARATMVPGLCQIDRLTLLFRPEGGETGDAATPVSVNGFETTHYYHFRRPLSDPFNTIVDRAKEQGDAQCRGATLAADPFFSAPDDQVAADGYLVAHRAMDAIVAGNPPFSLSCELYPLEAGRGCAAVIGEVRSEPVSSIESCETDLPDHKSDLCYRVYVGDRSLRILASGYSYGPHALPPLTVKRVVMDSLIVMTHERVD